MSEQGAEMAAAAKAVYAAINRNDIPAAVSAFDEQIERTEPPGFPQSGVYHGINAVQAHFAAARATWAEGACEPRRVVVSGDKVVVFVDVRVRLKAETEWRVGTVADGFAFRNGKITQFRTFVQEQQALEWAGLPASDSA